MAYFTVSKVLQSITDKGSQYEYGLHTKLKDCPSIIVEKVIHIQDPKRNLPAKMN